MPSAMRANKVAWSNTRVESAYGTEVLDANLTDLITVTEPDQVEIKQEYRTDEDEINGYLGATEAEIESVEGARSFKTKGILDFIISILYLTYGNLTTTGSSDPYTHTIKQPSVCVLNPPSTSFIEGFECAGSTGTILKHEGVCVDSFTIEGNGKKAVMVTTNVKTSGLETAKASFVFPAAPAAPVKFLGSEANVQMANVGSSLDDYTSTLRNWKISGNSGLVIPESAHGGLYVPEYQYGEGRPNIEFEYSLKADKSNVHWTKFREGTKVKLQFSLIRSASRQIVMSSANGYLTVTPGRQGNEPRLNCKFMPLHNSTDSGAVTFTAKTSTAAFGQNGSA